VDNIESASNAFTGGAIRIELCSSLALGGLTPSIGFLKTVKQLVSIPVFVMIRPRDGDFLYTDLELQIMRQDIESLKASGADGFVFGLLNSDGSVDKKRTKELVDICRPLPVTFHRAIDVSRDVLESLEDVISVGCERVLTSGGKPTACEGADVIRQMIEISNNRIIVMPGSGITEENLRDILERTGAKEFHGSARSCHKSRMQFHQLSVSVSSKTSSSDSELLVTDSDKVRTMMKIASTLSAS